MKARRLLHSAVLAACALVLLAPAARADDRAVKLSINPPDGPPFHQARATGMTFTDKKEDIEITCGEKKVPCTEANATGVRFMIPTDAAPGILKIKVKIKGGTSGEGEFRVIDPKDKKAIDAYRNAERERLEGGGTNFTKDYEKTEELLNVTKMTIDNKATPATLTVEGETSLPRDFFFSVTFGFENAGETQLFGDKLTSAWTEGKAKVWKAIFPAPGGKQFLSGRYYTIAEFEISKQNALTLSRAKWPASLTKGQKEAYARIHKKAFLDFGTPEDIKKEDVLIKAHYQDLAKRAGDACEILEKAYVSAGKSYFKKPSGSGYDEDAWQKWAQERGTGNTDDEVKKLKADNRFLKGVHFGDEAWKLWMETDFLKTLADIWNRELTMKNKFWGTRDEQLQSEAELMVGTVFKHAMTYSTELYERFKLTVPESLKGGGTEFASMPDSGPVSKNDFDTRRKVLLERLAQMK
jgi:hypothetical protein